MDLLSDVNKRFGQAAKKASLRLSRGPKSKSKDRHGGRTDRAARLMDRILKASRPDGLADTKPKVVTNG